MRKDEKKYEMLKVASKLEAGNIFLSMKQMWQKSPTFYGCCHGFLLRPFPVITDVGSHDL